MESFRPSILWPRRPSLLRGVLLALGALAASLLLAGLPFADAPRGSVWQFAPALADFYGMIETARCLGRRWSFYHVGVLILLYSELMILSMVLFFWVYL